MKKQISLLGTLGLLLLLGGLLVGGYFLIYFDTSVEVPKTELFGQTYGGGRVNNLGLMNTRQNGINLGFGAAVVGLFILGFQHYKKSK